MKTIDERVEEFYRAFTFMQRGSQIFKAIRRHLTEHGDAEYQRGKEEEQRMSFERSRRRIDLVTGKRFEDDALPSEEEGGDDAGK